MSPFLTACATAKHKILSKASSSHFVTTYNTPKKQTSYPSSAEKSITLRRVLIKQVEIFHVLKILKWELRPNAFRQTRAGDWGKNSISSKTKVIAEFCPTLQFPTVLLVLEKQKQLLNIPLPLTSLSLISVTVRSNKD